MHLYVPAVPQVVDAVAGTGVQASAQAIVDERMTDASGGSGGGGEEPGAGAAPRTNERRANPQVGSGNLMSGFRVTALSLISVCLVIPGQS